MCDREIICILSFLIIILCAVIPTYGYDFIARRNAKKQEMEYYINWFGAIDRVERKF